MATFCGRTGTAQAVFQLAAPFAKAENAIGDRKLPEFETWVQSRMSLARLSLDGHSFAA